MNEILEILAKMPLEKQTKLGVALTLFVTVVVLFIATFVNIFTYGIKPF